MKQLYRCPVMQVLDLADEDVLTSSPLSTKSKDAPVDNCSWDDIIKGSNA